MEPLDWQKAGFDPDIIPGHHDASIFPKLTAGYAANVEAAKGDAVNLPAHYARYKIEPIRFMVENFGPGILVGKVIKYSMRYDAKNGMEDLKKAKRCLELLIKFVAGDPDWWKRDEAMATAVLEETKP